MTTSISMADATTAIAIAARPPRSRLDKRPLETLCEDDFATLAGLGAEILLLGTGNSLRFPSPALLQPLMAARTGLEVMDTRAACRTFNILAAEGRKVAAAILLI